MTKIVDIRDYPVMQKQCVTCPFRVDEHGRHPNPVLVAQIQVRCLSEQGSQICHHPRLSNKPQTHLCRGARDFQLTVFSRLGLLAEPTDEAWEMLRSRFALG